MGGKSHSTNDQMIAFQQQQAAEARQREADRQARLDQGKAAINSAFQGGGFDDAFYNKYQNAALDYSLPQLTDQYNKAKETSTYDLARAGTLRSSGAGDVLANIEKEKAVNEASIRAKADQDTSALRTHIADQQQTALNQLYSTEDPTIAANTATGMVNQSMVAQPNLSPLGELFKPLIIGGGAGAASAIDNYYVNQGRLKANSPSGTGSSSSGNV